jgi:hypothetical protein
VSAIRNVKKNRAYDLDNASEFLIVRADKLRIVKYPSGKEKLFQRPFLLPVIMVTLIAILLIPIQLNPNPSMSLSLLLTSTQSAFAYHGQEIMLSINNSSFTPLTIGQGNQVKVLTNYNVQNSSTGGQTINAVMKLYTSNGTLIKTSSYPSGFIAVNTNGTAELKSTVDDPTVKSAIANITLTNAAKTEALSNEISTTVNLQDASSTPTTNTTVTSGEGIEQPSEILEPAQQMPSSQLSPSPPPEQEGIQGEENVPQPTPSQETEAPGIIPPFG